MQAAVLVRPQSDLTHKGASEVFELAEKQPVLIKRRHDADEVLLSADAYDALLRFTRNLALLTRALAKGPELMPDLDGLQWTRLFDLDERTAMLREFVESTRASFERKDPSILNAAWRGWEHSSALMADTETMKRLTKPLDAEATIPLARPIG